MHKLLIPLALALTACTSIPKDQSVRPYTSDTCIVMDSKLGTMGDPIVRVYDGQEVKFCCEPCVAEFESDPEFYLEKMREE